MDRTYWGLAAAMLVTAVGAGLFFGLWRPRPPGPPPSADADVFVVEPNGVQEVNAHHQLIVVHVSGRVSRPGLVRVDANARVGDVIMAAGGALGDARLGEINLAAPVVDGAQVVVPGPTTGMATGTNGANDPSLTEHRISLNQATVQQLVDIPGVGPVLARRIVDHRDAAGPFREVEDLLDVSGIGEKKLAGLREYVTVP